MNENIKALLIENENMVKNAFETMNHNLNESDEFKAFLESFKGKYLVTKRKDTSVYVGKVVDVIPKFVFNQINYSLAYSVAVKIENPNRTINPVHRINILREDYMLFETEEDAKANSEVILERRVQPRKI